MTLGEMADRKCGVWAKKQRLPVKGDVMAIAYLFLYDTLRAILSYDIQSITVASTTV